MLQLLNPIALLAIAAVAIPVLVHLWNVRKGKTLRVGSIALLTASSRTRSNRLRINNWPLFLLRCLLLVLLALLLARPVWKTTPTPAGHPGWVLAPVSQLATAYTHYKPQIDSLLAAGLELRNLSAGFERIRLQDTASLTDTGDAVLPRPWPLLKELDASLPNGFPLYVFTDNRLVSYQGERPVTHLAIRWHSFTPGDSMASSPALSYVTTEGKIKNIERVSTPQGNWYNAADPRVLFTSAPDTAIVRIAIYAGRYAADAQYIKAALQAIEQFTGKRISITSLAGGQLPATQQDVLFWLDGAQGEPAEGRPASRQAQPGAESVLSYVAPQGTLFRYDTGRAIPVSSWLQEGNTITATAGKHHFYQYISGHSTGNPVWKLADGRPLLTVTEQDGKRVYHFKSRFHPAWGDLVWEDDFVKKLLSLVVPSVKGDIAMDKRRIDDRQAAPVQRSESGAGRSELGVGSRKPDGFIQRQATALSNGLWALIFMVFIIERIMDYRQQRMRHG